MTARFHLRRGLRGARPWKTTTRQLALPVVLCFLTAVRTLGAAGGPAPSLAQETVATDPVPDELPSLAAVQQALAHARTVFTRFTQERHLALFNEPLRSEGWLCSEQSGNLRWETTQPYRSILVSDGRGVAQFERVGEAWKKLDLGMAHAVETVVRQIGLVIQGRYGNAAQGYTVTVGRSDEGPVLTLVPRAEPIRRMLESIEVQLTPDLQGTRQVMLRETSGDFTRIRFRDQQLNGSFPEGTFDRQDPLSLETVRARFTQAKPPQSAP